MSVSFRPSCAAKISRLHRQKALCGVAANESAALNASVDPFRARLPQPAIGPGQRVDFKVRQLEASIAQRREGGTRSLEKIGAELLVCQNLPYDQLHVFLRH